MKLNKLSLDNQGLFKRYLGRFPCELAAYSFANIYLWQPLYNVHWAVSEDSLCVFFRDRLGCFMYLPPLTTAPTAQLIQQVFAVMDKVNKNQNISRIENIQAHQLDYFRSLGYLCYEKYPDYLCLRSDLANLRGNQFKSQRAAYNYFIKHYDYKLARLALTDQQECLSLFAAWAQERKARRNDDVYCGMLEDNRRIIREVFADYQKLRLIGLVVRLNNEIKAFSFGYQLNADTFCILYEITDLSAKGLAQFIFRRFSQELKKYKFINIMDDSGLENLRRSKLAYHPQRLIPAYIAIRDERKY